MVFGLWSLVFGLWSWVLGFLCGFATLRLCGNPFRGPMPIGYLRVTFPQSRKDAEKAKSKNQRPKTKNQIPNLKCGAACVRETQAANFSEGFTVGYAEMIGKRQLFLVGDCVC
jgi:hypothetical protein